MLGKQAYAHALALFIMFINSVGFCDAYFTDKFRKFLREMYGPTTEKLLTREDMGPGGSFGGGLIHDAGWPTRRRPVFIVHGIANTASTFSKTQHYFLKHGYADEEVYGMTFGDGGRTRMMFVSMECEFLKSIRLMMRAIVEYTNSQMDIIAYSMGSPIARKAIKGGVCVDTGEDLGPPLTGFVYTLISVAGANFGSYLCHLPFGSCNTKNGLSCGSKFLADINSVAHYEGKYVYTIFSPHDDRVGYSACGRLASAITKEDRRFVISGLLHDQVMFDTIPLQYTLIANNTHART